MSSRIPGARQRLLNIADDLTWSRIDQQDAAAEIRTVVETMMFRTQRDGKPQAARANYMTRSMRAEIKRYAKKHPKARPGTIAKVFGTDPDRTRAVLQGGK